MMLASVATFEIKAQSLPAFPGAEGFGRNVTGGRGGDVYRVTTLDDCSDENLVEGTFRYACKNAANSTIIFDVSGTIFLKSPLALTASNVTIAGQTAPGDGICIADYPFTLASNNVILRYLRFRLGNQKVAEHEGDGLGGNDISDVIVDHCSISWSIDECVSLFGIKNLTVQWSLIAQSLRDSGHIKGAHGYGGNWGGAGATYHHNLLCHHDSRTPRLGPRSSTQTKELLDMRNNVFYNWAGNGCYGGEGMKVNIVNNYYKPGPATRKKGGAVAYRIASIGVRTTKYCTSSINGKDTIWNDWKPMHHVWGKFFVDGNYIDGNSTVTNDNWTKGIYEQTTNGENVDYLWTQATKDSIRLSAPLDFAKVTTHTATVAYDRVLDYAGASLRRDSFDKQMVYDTRNNVATYGNSGNSPGFVDSQNDNKPVGATSDWSAWPTLTQSEKLKDTDGDGIPDYWEMANDMDPNDPSDRNNRNSTGYTMLELYINSLVNDITIKQLEGGVEQGIDIEQSQGSDYVLISGGWNSSSPLLSIASTGGMSSKSNADANKAITSYDISEIVSSSQEITLGDYFDITTAVPCKFENNTYTLTAKTGYNISEIHSLGYTTGEPKPTFGSVFRQIGGVWDASQTVKLPTSTNPNLTLAGTTDPNLTSVYLGDYGDYPQAVKITRGGRENACCYVLKLEPVKTSVKDAYSQIDINVVVTSNYVYCDSAVEIAVYSVNGNIARKARGQKLDISTLQKGIYIINVVRENGTLAVKKIVR